MYVVHVPSASPTKRTARAERRELLIDTLLERATELLEEGGLDALTLQRVAQSLGYVTTAVYRYFPSKDALVAAMQRKAIADVEAHFVAELARRASVLDGAAEPTRALAVLLHAADIYLALPSTRPRAWYLIAILLGDPRPLLSDEESQRAAPVLAGFLENVVTLFEAASASGALDRGPARDRTLAYWASLHGALCLEKARRIVPALPASTAVGADLARVLLASWGASGARLSAAERVVSNGKGK